MSDIKQRIIDCFAILGGTEVAIPRTLIYEDTILPLSRLEASSAAWRNILTSMAELQQIMPAFDLNLEKKIVTRGYFRARYGAGQRCDDFLSFADEFRQNFFEQYLQGAKNTFGKKNTINHFQQPELDLLNQVPEVVTSSMLQAIARHQATGTADILLHEDFIQALAPYVPASVDRICSHAFFTQLAYEQGEALGVINHIYAGFTQNFSRFAHLFQDEENSQVLSTLKTTLQELCPPDVIFAELKGGYDATNLNIHSPVTAYELVCPGDKSSRAPDEQIPLEDLFLVDDEKAGRLKLCSKRLGKEVIPLYLGFLLPMALPEIQQILLNFSYASMCVLDLWKGMKEAPSETIVSYPRLRYKHLVLQRAYWKLTANLFPQRESGQDDFTFFLNINRWRRKLGLPRRLFLAPEKTFGTQKAQSASADEGAAAPQIRNYKPLFLDFENIFAVTLLEALVRDSTQTLVLSEVLPGQEQLWLKHRGQSYVSEFVLEMNTVKEESDA